MTVFDAHAHAGDAHERDIRQLRGVCTMLSCGNVQQAAQGLAICRAYPVFTMTAGIHPWYADSVSFTDMEPYMRNCTLIGEIGLDSVWCTTPMAAQRKAFSAQLDWACAHGKGVVLHTKGCENDIARMIAGFPHPVVVHWYSGDEGALERFLSADCYFTIGPDVQLNTSVQAVARRVSDDRILFETDGMEAVRWALGEMPTDSLCAALEQSVRTAAALRGCDAQTLAEKANGNFQRLL